MSDVRSTGRSQQSARQLIVRLLAVKSRFSESETAEKRSILQQIGDIVIRDPRLLIKLHKALCFLRAFPDSADVHRLASELLNGIHERIKHVPRGRRSTLDDSGIAGTTVCHEYSYSQAQWLADRYPEHADISWKQYESPEKLDDLLTHILTPAAEDYFQSGEVATREWVRLAKGSLPRTDLRWLLEQLKGRPRLDRIWRELYDAAEVPIQWNLAASNGSITRNVISRDRIAIRSGGMRKPTGSLATIIRKPLKGIKLLKERDGRRAIDAAMTALAVRHRDVYSMAHANPREVYLASLGRGTELAVFGVLPEFRPVLEGNFGYLLLSNGAPIGYGGVSPLSHQANTGVNIFEEYRGSEASYLFAQTLRMFHALFGSRRFIINPYQFGERNSEAIRSGAFWFYYRLGFRPEDKQTRSLARKEEVRLEKRPGTKSDPELLRTLSNSTMVFDLPGFRASEGFDESWITTCSRAATTVIADQACATHAGALRCVARSAMKSLGVRTRTSWQKEERGAFDRMAPIVSLCKLGQWSRKEKADLVSLMRAQGQSASRRYIQRLRVHGRFLEALRAYCRRNA